MRAMLSISGPRISLTGSKSKEILSKKTFKISKIKKLKGLSHRKKREPRSLKLRKGLVIGSCADGTEFLVILCFFRNNSTILLSFSKI